MFRKILILFLFAFSVFAEYNPNVCGDDGGFGKVSTTATSSDLYELKTIDKDVYLASSSIISMTNKLNVHNFTLNLPNYNCASNTFCFSSNGTSLFEDILKKTITFITSKNCNLSTTVLANIKSKTLDSHTNTITETTISDYFYSNKKEFLLKQNIQFNRDTNKDYFTISFTCNKSVTPAYIPFTLTDLKNYLKTNVNWNYKQLKKEYANILLMNQSINEDGKPIILMKFQDVQML